MLRRRIATAAAAGVLGLTAGTYAIASSAAARSSGHAAASGTLTIGDIQPVGSWAAADSNWANQSPFYQAVYDGLFHATPSGKIVPWLATSYKFNKQQTVMTLQLRRGVKFTDGTSFNAKVAALNIMDFKHGVGGTTSPNADDLSLVKVAKAVGPYTLKIFLAAPDPALPTYLSQNPGLMESAKGLASKNVNTVPDGSGPYIYDAAASVPGSTWVFTKNPHYWAPQSVHYAKLVIKYYQTNQAMLDAMQAHQLNYANTDFDPSDEGEVSSAGFRVVPYYLNWEGLILLDRNGKDARPLANVKVRQAINYAINDKTLLSILNQGKGQFTDQVFAPSSPAYLPSLNGLYGYNPAKARKLMKEAGYAHGFTISLPTVAITPEAAYAVIQSDLAAIGIKVNLTTASLSTYIADMLKPQWPLVNMELQEDPTPFMVDQFEIAPNASFNPFHTSSPVLNKYLAAVQHAKTPAAARTAAQAVNRYVIENAWFDPWFRPLSIGVADASTNAPAQADNCDSYLYSITPKA